MYDILNKLDEGYSYRDLAEEYQIGTATTQRWKKHPEPKAYVYTVYKIDSEALKVGVEAYQDAYQVERARRFNGNQRTIGRSIKRLGITQKKDFRSS